MERREKSRESGKRTERSSGRMKFRKRIHDDSYIKGETGNHLGEMRRREIREHVRHSRLHAGIAVLQ